MAIAESVAMRFAKAGAGFAARNALKNVPTCGGCYDSGTGRCRAEGAALVPVTAPRLLAGRYRLERRLGRGGMGTVYVALDTSLDRRVAAKLVREDLVGLPGAAERFQREARVAAAFSHPNVVTVHDFGVAGAHAFLVMELLDGRTLRDVLRAEERIDAQRALAILRDVTAAVEAAHRRQLVHRDLKPENICLVSHGSSESAKVLDFGIAKFLTRSRRRPAHDPRDRRRAARHAVVYGARAASRRRSRSELGSVGAGRHRVRNAERIASVRVGDARPRPRTRESAADPRLAHLPNGCQQFFARALALDRAARPESAAVFLAELERSLHA